LILLTSTIGYVFNFNSAKNLEKMYTENMIAIEDLGDMRGNLNRIIADILNLFQYTTPAETSALANDIKTMKDKNTALLDDFLKTNPNQEQTDKLNELKQVRTAFWLKMNKSMELADLNKNGEAYAVYKSNLSNVTNYRSTLLGMIKTQKDLSQQLFEANEDATRTASILLVLIGISSLVLMVFIGITISNGITRPINHAIGELTAGSSEVSAASAQVQSASHALAEGTLEQSASIQETSSTLEETSSMVQQNNDNTKQAAALAKHTKEFAKQSNTEMSVMMQAMVDLKQSSNEIAKIIKVIDEIAFQTNLLSLNAAVEAARAGEAGKGFAVVAEEVRSLAQRSAQAAKDTASIIERNISLSDNSAGLAKHVNESLSQIDIEANKVSELLEEIATATEEQSRGVHEINKAIQQMEQVMQSNSSTADESAAASKELANQAEHVNQIVNVLTILVKGATSANRNTQIVLNTTQKAVSQHAPRTYSKSTLMLPQKSSKPEEMIPLNDF